MRTVYLKKEGLKYVRNKTMQVSISDAVIASLYLLFQDKDLTPTEWEGILGLNFDSMYCINRLIGGFQSKLIKVKEVDTVIFYDAIGCIKEKYSVENIEQNLIKGELTIKFKDEH